MASIYANLPDILLKGVLDFAPQEEGMYRLTYDYKMKKYVKRANPHYAALNKVNQFKIDNPPKWDVTDPNFDEVFGHYPHDILMNIEIKYPLKLRKREGLRDRLCVDEERYLVLDFTHSMSFEGFTTKKCSLRLPEYYHYLISRKRFIKSKNYHKNHSKDLVFA